MPIRKGPTNGASYSPILDFNSLLPTLPRKMRFTFNDLEIDKRWPALNHVYTLTHLRELSNSSDSVAKDSIDAMDYVKQWFKALMIHFSELFPEFSLDNNTVTSKAKNLESTPAHYNFIAVEEDWDSLAGHLLFLDPAMIASGFSGDKQKMARERIMKSPERKTALVWNKEWNAKYDAMRTADAIEASHSIKQLDRATITTMTRRDMQKHGLTLDIKNYDKLKKADLRTAIERALGYLPPEDESKPQGLPPITSEEIITSDDLIVEGV